MRIGLKVVILAAIVISILCGTNASGAAPLNLPEGVQYHYFVSLVTGYESIWSNPAALGLDRTTRIVLAGDWREESQFENWGGAILGDGLGISYRTLENFQGANYNEYIFAAGAELGTGLAWGLSYIYISEGPGYYNHRHLWNLGIVFNRGSQYTVGAVLMNLNRGRIDGERTAVSHRYGISYFPFNEKLALSLEMTLPAGNFSEAEYRYGLCVRPSPDLEVYTALDGHRNFQFGIRVFLDKYFGAARSHLSSGDYGYTSVAAGIAPFEPRGDSGRRTPTITDQPRQPRE